ncbi:MAG: DUF3800 domain-containing protein [Burkholderiales bacterium]
MKYRIYIDEVGNSDLDSSEDPNHRFLSLTGVIVDLEHVEKVIHPEMEALKTRYFRHHPDDPVIFHRKEMLNAKGSFEVLGDEGTRRKFDEELLDRLRAWEYRVVSVCLDKKRHKETYAVWRYDPYHYGLAILLERFVFYLERVGAPGDVLAESRGGNDDRRLKDSFARLWEKGTEYVSPDRFQKVLTSKQLKVKPKINNLPGLQLADLVAHPSRNEMLREQKLLDRALAPFAQRVIQVLQTKYDQDEGRIFGKKFV